MWFYNHCWGILTLKLLICLQVAYSCFIKEDISGWTTNVGVNTSLALNNPDPVIAVYQNAQLNYNQWGNILQVKDHQLRIEINWFCDFYTGRRYLSMGISHPSKPPPSRKQFTLVERIELTANKTKGDRHIIALVQVQNDRELVASGVNVFAAWNLPDGSTLPAEDLPLFSGYACFKIRNASRRTYTLNIEDVELTDHIFDSNNTVLSASIKVK